MLDNLDPLAHPSGEPPGHLDPAAELVVGDLRDRRRVDRALEGVDRVFHLGGIVGNGESMVNVRKAIDSNAGRHRDAARGGDRPPRRDPAASSSPPRWSSTARAPTAAPSTATRHARAAAAAQLRERDWEPRLPRCGAGARAGARARGRAPAAGQRLRDHQARHGGARARPRRAYGFEAVALRYLNIYGPRQALGNPYTGVAAIFSARLLGRPGAARLRGRRPDPRPRPRLRRRRARPRPRWTRPDAPGHAINVGHRPADHGSPSWPATLCELLGSELEPEITGEFRAGDIRHCFADTTLAEDAARLRGEGEDRGRAPELVRWVGRAERRHRARRRGAGRTEEGGAGGVGGAAGGSVAGESSTSLGREGRERGREA